MALLTVIMLATSWIVYATELIPWLLSSLEHCIVITWRSLMAILHWLLNLDEYPEIKEETASSTSSCHRFNCYQKSYCIYTILNQYLSLSRITYVFHSGCGWCLQFCSGAISYPGDLDDSQETYYQVFWNNLDMMLDFCWPGRPPNSFIRFRAYLSSWIGCSIVIAIVLFRIYHFQWINHWRDHWCQRLQQSKERICLKMCTFALSPN